MAKDKAVTEEVEVEAEDVAAVDVNPTDHTKCGTQPEPTRVNRAGEPIGNDVSQLEG